MRSSGHCDVLFEGKSTTSYFQKNRRLANFAGGSVLSLKVMVCESEKRSAMTQSSCIRKAESRGGVSSLRICILHTTNWDMRRKEIHSAVRYM